jgi:glycosyltransferase involved in cell wall biosynthesis
VRVALVPHAYWPSIGGAERYAQGLAEGLAGLGHEAHVVAADVTNPEAFYELGHDVVGVSEESIAGVKVHRIPFSTFRYRRLGWLGGADKALRSAIERFRRELAVALSGLEPQVVITLPHLFPNVEEVLRLRATQPWKLIYAPMLHEDDPYWSIERVSKAVTAADGVIALTEHERERLFESYGAVSDTTAVIPPGVGLQDVGGSASRDPVVLFIGRRTPSKRLDVLYDAMQLVWPQEPAARLVVAGSPPAVGLDPAIWMAGDPRVTIVDSPSDEEKSRLLTTARLVVSPSLAESFGITTLEAWAHGTPVVVTDSPVNRSVVRDQVDGLVAAGSDAVGLAGALERLLGSPAVAESMGREGRRRVEAEFSWSSSAAAIEALIESV